MNRSHSTDLAVAQEIDELRARLAAALEVLEAIRRGEVDALVVGGSENSRIFTLEGADQPYRVLIEQMSEGAATLSGDGLILFCNRRFAELLGTPPERVTGFPLEAFVVPGDQALLRHMLESVSIGPSRGEVQVRNASGGTVQLLLSLGMLPSSHEERVGVVATDLTVRRQAEDRLRLAASVFSHAREGIMITSPEGTILDVNEAFSRITGYAHHDVLGHNARILSSGRHGKEFYVALWSELRSKGHWHGEVWNRRRSGEVYAELLTIGAVADDRGLVQHYVALFSDISAIKEHQRQLERIAHYDALTGLPNRILFADRLHQAMVQTQRRGSMLAVAYLDLDGFKEINDTHGHNYGDQLLTGVASRMAQTLREGDTLARLGGDEFVAVVIDLPGESACIPLLGRLLAAAAQPLHIGDLVLKVSASIGVTLYPQDEATDADLLLRQADQAMYQAKLAGRNRYEIFDPERDRNARGYHESIEHIHTALANREFELHFQPKVNMRSGVVIGVEALIRWNHPERGLLAPSHFLPAIEGHPLSVELGEWVIDEALCHFDAWRAQGLHLPVSVNLSPVHLQAPNFINLLREHLTAHPLAQPGDIELEVLESSALEDIAEVSRVIEACRAMGVGFALDDFGTGYSSLNYLKRLPASLLKIDQSFVRGMLDNPEDLAILEAILGLASAFQRDVIAEGVETIAHGEMLLQLGCELAQGYVIAHPMPGAAIPAWHAAWRAFPQWLMLPPRGSEELAVLSADAEHGAWSSALLGYLRGERDVPRMLDHRECRLGRWLGHEGAARYGGTSAFESVVRSHSQLHARASEVTSLQRADTEANGVVLACEIETLRDDLHAQLGALHVERRRSSRE